MAKQDLLLLHGALQDNSIFAQLLPELEPDFRIHTFNFEGHGNRTRNRPLQMENFCNNILEYATQNSLEKFSIFGYSMGGYAALLFASQNPLIIGKVFTLGTKMEWTPEIAKRETALLNPAIMLEKVPQFAGQLKAKHTGIGWEKLLSETAEMMKKLGDNPSLTPKSLKKITCPVIIGIGDKDKTVSIEESTNTASNIPQGKVEVFTNTPHPFEKVDIEVLSGRLKEFLNE